MASEDPNKQIIRATLDWFFANDEMAQRMEGWAATNCDVFDYVPEREQYEGTENKLEYTALYNDFTNLFEAEITHFLTSQGWSLEQFAAACEAEEKEEGGMGQSASDFILAITDFQTFKMMMLDEKKKKVEGAQ